MLSKTHFKRPFVGGSITEKIVNPDLAEERRNLFNKEEMMRTLLDESIINDMKLYADCLTKHPQL